MTNQQGAPAALRLAEELEHDPGINRPSVVAEPRRLHAENTALQQGYDAARLEIDSLHARVQELGAMLRANRCKRIVELEAQLEAIGAGGVEPLRRRECLHKIAEPAPAAVAGPSDPEIDALVASIGPTEGIRRDSRDLTMDKLRVLVRRALATWGHVKVVPVNAWQQAIDHELVTAHLGVAGAATLEEARKALHELICWHIDVATDPATNGGKVLVDAARAPADSQPAPQGETNAQLDTDSNPPTPGQQRDVAGPVALGQPVGNGSDQAAGHTGAQGDKLLTVAERNIRSFLRSAVFKSESDREAALNCVDVLWEAARAPADSVTAPAGGTNTKTAELLSTTVGLLMGYREGGARQPYRPGSVIAKTVDEVVEHLKDWPYPEPTPPAQAADSVLEDAARYQWLVDYLISDRTYLDDAIIACASKHELDAVIDAGMAAARKQGANHD